jgi:hypothetical protein
MAEGTRLFQVSESLRECQEAINLQYTVNTEVQQCLLELHEMMQTRLANQVLPPPAVINHGHLERVPGRDDRRQQDPELDGHDNMDFRHHQPEDDHDQFRGETDLYPYLTIGFSKVLW